jgi:hypothetical protein
MSLLHIPADYQKRWTDDSLPSLSKNFEWQGREDYFAWVDRWKSLLQAEIDCIRSAKEVLRGKDASVLSRAAAQRERALTSIRCRNLYFLRMHSKIQAGRQTATKEKREYKNYITRH